MEFNTFIEDRPMAASNPKVVICYRTDAKNDSKNTQELKSFLVNAPQTLKQRDKLLEVCKAIVRAKCLIIPNDAEVSEEHQGELRAIVNLISNIESLITEVEDST